MGYFVEPYYVRARYVPESFVGKIERYEDGQYTVRHNALTGYDVIMRPRPASWRDEFDFEHWRLELMPTMTLMYPGSERPWRDTSPDYWIRELQRTDIRNVGRISQVIRDMDERNAKLLEDKEEDYRTKQAIKMAKRMESGFASTVIVDSPIRKRGPDEI